jgi:hypothetical protein
MIAAESHDEKPLAKGRMGVVGRCPALWPFGIPACNLPFAGKQANPGKVAKKVSFIRSLFARWMKYPPKSKCGSIFLMFTDCPMEGRSRRVVP